MSLYLSGKSGLSLDKLAVLLKNGMKLEEAFGEDVADAVRAGLLQNVGASDPLEIVTEGLRRILDALDGLKIKKQTETKLKPNLTIVSSYQLEVISKHYHYLSFNLYV